MLLQPTPIYTSWGQGGRGNGYFRYLGVVQCATQGSAEELDMLNARALAAMVSQGGTCLAEKGLGVLHMGQRSASSSSATCTRMHAVPTAMAPHTANIPSFCDRLSCLCATETASLSRPSRKPLWPRGPTRPATTTCFLTTGCTSRCGAHVWSARRGGGRGRPLGGSRRQINAYVHVHGNGAASAAAAQLSCRCS